jgi:zinc D-Ala-D-Ala carboxypeptidase
MKPAFYFWNRGERQQLSPHFVSTEFTCRCGICRRQAISTDLLDKLETLRTLVGKPLTITSAYRCDRYQAYLYKTLPKGNTVPRSTHQDGNAVDVKWEGFDITEAEKLAEQAGFQAVGLAKRFVHIDLRMGKRRRWIYA